MRLTAKFCCTEILPAHSAPYTVSEGLCCLAYMCMCNIYRPCFVILQANDSGEFKTIVVFECRGIETVDFDPRVSYYAR